MSPSRRREAVKHLQAEHAVSERRACSLASQHRSTQRAVVKQCAFEDRLVAEMKKLTRAEPSWGSPRVFDRLRIDAWHVNHKRVERLWRNCGFQVVRKVKKRRRVGNSANGIARKRAEYPGHVWTYDFLTDRTEDSRRLKV